ncbi:MAG TPA: hypothetical protein PK110_03420 [Niabella sp.]|jgi:hypothetical protein|nr:hypothetical protein [Chitinophagaceae bacterium]HRO83851.1 hypothetical protein [Niabella sp.]
MVNITKYVKGERYYFFKKFNVLVFSAIFLFYLLSAFMDMFLNKGLKAMVVNDYLLKHHALQLGTAYALFLIYSLSDEFKSGKIQLQIANGFSANEIFLLKIIDLAFLALISLVSYFLMDALLNVNKFHQVRLDLSLTSVGYYLLVPAYLSLIMILFYLMTRHFILATILFFIYMGLELFLSEKFHISDRFLPLKTLIKTVHNNEFHFSILLFSALFLISDYLLLNRIKNWGKYK